MWRGSGSGELGSIVCQRAAGFSPLNYRSGMFPAADSPSAPTRVGASQAGEGAGAGAGPRPGDRARPGGGQQQETPPAVSAPGSWARAGISAPGAKLQPGARLLRVHQRAVLPVEVECGAHLPGWGGAQGPAVGQGSLQQSAPPCPFWKALPSGALWAGITSTPPPGGEAEAQTGAEGVPLHQLPAGGVQGEQETCLGRPLRG